jgi:outer membrane protein, multidrug efflux system
METKIMTRYFLNNRLRLALPLFIGITFLGGCAVGPNYKRPSVDVPVAYRAPAGDESSATKPEQQPATSQAATPSAASLGDEKWWEVFQDKELQGLIRTALKNNYDVRIAATRVLQARLKSELRVPINYPL